MKLVIALLVVWEVSGFQVVCPFENGAEIPIEYTTYGADMNPELQIRGEMPEGTVKLALAVNDPDAPNGLWTHWLVQNIDGDVRVIAENSVPGSEVTNSWNLKKYKGPRPPSGTHRYFFIIYALSQEIQASNSSSFYSLVQQYGLGSGSCMGVYSSQ